MSVVPVTVVRVVDGDTVVVQPQGLSALNVRIAGIDAPERPRRGSHGQPYGEEAARYMERLLPPHTHATLVVDGRQARDRYGRTLGTLLHGNAAEDVALQMLESGLAWQYRTDRDEARRAAAARARASGAGLWAQTDPEEPWNYRRRIKERKHTA